MDPPVCLFLHKQHYIGVSALARKKPNPARSLYRFIYGIYAYYTDRGMPQKTAKARMMDSTFQTCVDIMRKEKELSDEMLVIMAQWMSRALNNRGAYITKQIEKKYPQGTVVPESELVPLRKLKSAKDAMDDFIQTYKGWCDDDGKGKESQ